MSRKTFEGAHHSHRAMLVLAVAILTWPVTITTFARSCALGQAVIITQLNGRPHVTSVP